ncbi:ATP-binding protein [Treponema primitia]|uniref:ATP-binding protein n=1 Tax=Treponema primitia TaxID=88058 RepID=UPI00397F2517
MKFYGRTKEIEELNRIGELAFTDHSRMTVITGRRRIGKTSLITMATAKTPTAYLFVGRKDEAAICGEFAATISTALNVFIPEGINRFQVLFQYLMDLATRRPFTLVIDEFQEFLNINPSVYHDMQHLWDQYKDRSRMHLILCGSVYSFMQRIFQDSKEPLFGRADNIIKLSPFDLTTLKKIMTDYRPKYSNDELLALYAFTGGIPKYIEMFCDNLNQEPGLSIPGMIDFMVRDNSPFIEEGKYLLIEEFGKNYGVYFSILDAVAGGLNTQPAIASTLGDKSIGGHIKRLIEDYNILIRRRPILAKEGTQTVRYEIADNFLQFWFNYFDRYRSMIEIKNFTGLRSIIKADYTTYSGRILERYFRQQLAESQNYRDIGSWWEGARKGSTGDDQNEIDIVALGLEKNRALAVEVKRQRGKYKPTLLAAKIERLKEKALPGYEVEGRCLTLEDM